MTLRFLVLGLLALPCCDIPAQRVFVTPLAGQPTALPAGCPVEVSPRVPLAGEDVQPLAIVRCQPVTGEADCEAEIRNAVCRLGGNYAFGVHDERGVIVATIAVYGPALRVAGTASPRPQSVGDAAD
jgi:hypothetical protein